jgi:hypothetical protein
MLNLIKFIIRKHKLLRARKIILDEIKITELDLDNRLNLKEADKIIAVYYRKLDNYFYWVKGKYMNGIRRNSKIEKR